MEENNVKIWGTFDGRYINVEDMDHQHMSNIVHFMKHISPEHYPQDIKDFFIKKVNDKFGKLLDYHPHPLFGGEISVLRNKGYLQDNGDILVKGEKIGEYMFNRLN
jgi:hypothetical protein